jgi:hypothetical protein
VSRAKIWSPSVEDAFRVQKSGYRDVAEYEGERGPVERHENGDRLISMTFVKNSTVRLYWRKWRETSDGDLIRVKIYNN